MEKMYRYTGTLVMGTGLPGQQHEKPYDFVCDEMDYAVCLLEEADAMIQEHIEFDTKDQTVEEVKE